METVAPAPLEPVSPSATASGSWSFPLLLAFRFVFCYFLLYVAPTVAGLLDSVLRMLYPPLTEEWFTELYLRPWHLLAPWVATRFFHLSGHAVTYFPTGSGDTTLSYIESVCYLVIALGATILWSVLDWKRIEYRRLRFWLRILIRYVLGSTMLAYGFVKVFPLQFRAPGFDKLLEVYGDFSPMGVLWNFMGASTAYIMFSGVLEVLGGLLLFFRRTTLLGALVCTAVLVNIVALNLCYDVPVKLYSFHLLLMAIFLLVPDLRRVWNVLYLHRASQAVDLDPYPFRRKWMRTTILSVKCLLVGVLLIGQIWSGWQGYQTTANAKHPPLYGVWEVEQFTRNGQELPPLLTDSFRWRKLVVQYPQFWVARLMNDSASGYNTEYDTDKHTVAVRTQANGKKEILSYASPDADHIALEGTLQNSPVVIRLRKVDHTKFLLVSRGFHWITETPFNR